jgi:peptide/nickel transport system ATP-binding protein
MTTDAVLEIKNLQTHFLLDSGTIRAVDGASLTVNRGKTLGVIGESGCGKSVTAHSILRLIPSPPGKIVGGEILLHREGGIVDLTKLNPFKAEMRHIRGNDIGMIFQEPMTSFGPLHTIGNQIMETILVHNPDVSKAEARARTISLLDRVGIPNAAMRVDSYPHEFSGGMRQRAMIAMALSCSPMMLIADEPTTALDVTIEAQILELLIELQESSGMAIMLISHNLAVVSEMAHDIAVMYLGKRVEFGTNEHIARNPLHPYTRGLWNSIPSVDGPLKRLKPIPGIVPSARNLPPGCVFSSRCAHFMPGLCDTPRPVPDVEAEPGHFVSCYLYTDEGRAYKRAEAGPVVVDKPEAVIPEVEKTGEPILAVRNLKQYFPIQKGFLRRTIGYVKAVNEVNLTINKGETLGLVGESGCGKSTLGRSILRLYEPTGGEVVLYKGDKKLSILELDRRGMRQVRSTVQMIFQDPFASLNDRMTVLQNVIEPLVCNNIGTPSDREARAEKLLTQVGLRKEHLRRYPHSFSGGQRQRIGIARALSIQPTFIVADEPVSALDVSVQAQILNLMRDLQADFGLSYLFISHDMAVIRYMADRIAVMYVGKLVEYAPRDELLAHPAHPYTEALQSAVPHVSSHGRRKRIVLEGAPPDPSNLPNGCVFQNRCRYVQARCRQEEPELREIRPDHFAACHFSEELTLNGI